MRKLLYITSLLFLLVSCLKEPDYHSYEMKLAIDFGLDFPQDQKSGAVVRLFNQSKSYTYEASSNSEGEVIFASVEPGFYSITVTCSVQSGLKLKYFNGKKNIDVFDHVIDTIKVYGNTQSVFVIKEVYFSGSVTLAGKKYYADQYLELFNNTGEIQYADGISVLVHESSNTGTNMWQNIKDTIVAETIWTIPGSGFQYPVEPGKSIVIAHDGINHRSDPKGNPLSPVNLGNADFEFYVYKPNNQDVDSPAIPDMIEEYSGTDLLKGITYDVRGGSAIAIAKLPGQNTSERKNYLKQNLVPKPNASGSKTTYYPKVATSFILDAVETVRDEAHAVYKRFPTVLDAGYTYLTTGSYSGKCIRRKVEQIIDGRVVYQDTNNSTTDFLKDVDPKPKIYE